MGEGPREEYGASMDTAEAEGDIEGVGRGETEDEGEMERTPDTNGTTSRVLDCI
jgi:hypothetical protein